MIPFNRADITDSDAELLTEAIKRGHISGNGSFTKTAESLLAAAVNAPRALLTTSCTHALEMAALLTRVGPGDEVIVPSFTFVSSASAFLLFGAKPVFVDIKKDYNIDENKIEAAITKRTKAIMPVHWAGKPCELNKIFQIAKKYNLKIIQDSSHAIDTRYYGNSIVKYGDACTFSMHPLKNLNVWGDGGFILTNNFLLAKKLCLIRNHGLKDRNNCEVFSYNSRLDTIQAAVANYKLKYKLTNITNKRIKNAKLFDQLFSQNHNIITVPRNKNIKEVFHLYHINLKHSRNDLLKYLLSKNIDAKIHYPIPIHLQKASKFLKYKRGDFPVAEHMADTSLSLPVHEFIKKRDIFYVVKMIEKFYSKF